MNPNEQEPPQQQSRNVIKGSRRRGDTAGGNLGEQTEPRGSSGGWIRTPPPAPAPAPSPDLVLSLILLLLFN